MIQDADILMTGGAGTLGHAIAKLSRQEGWKGKFTVYSTDPHKHEKMKREYPELNFIQGDIRNPTTLYNAMVGRDIVIHAAAVKIIPTSEYYSIDTFDVNVNGSLNVCDCAIRAGVKDVLGISTDKACHAVNAYGASKYMMEKIFQEYSRGDFETKFHLVRFGNVLESNGSVIESWRRAVKNNEPLKITDPNMTRFWLSPMDAAKYAIDAIYDTNGCIFVPVLSALSIGKLAQYSIGKEDYPIENVPIRPGEKFHECLVTKEEGHFAEHSNYRYRIYPSISKHEKFGLPEYTSDIAPELTKQELEELLAEV